MDPILLAFLVIILLFSVIIHEVMHGLAALHFGDHTAEKLGRLTFNPIPHIDPIGTILLPLLLVISGSPLLFGWAKPVPINPFNFSNIRKGELVVSIAGVLANLSLAILAAFLFHLLQPILSTLLQNTLIIVVNINLILAVFNILPIPPLDGSKVLLSFLPPKLAIQYQGLEKYGFLILIFLLFVPFGSTSLLWAFMGTILSFLHFLLGV